MNARNCDFPAAIVKGLIEHNDGTIYFGSLMGYLYYLETAKERGLVTYDEPEKAVVTDKGKAFYKERQLDQYPQTPHSRASMWDWKYYR